MSVTTDRLAIVAKAMRVAADAATAEADDAQRLYEAEMALEQAEADRLAALNAEPMPAATPAAVAHAEETGVDLTQVEGTGVGGTILKADVAAAAADAPVEETAADVNAPEAAS